MIRSSDDLLSPSVHGRKNASRIRSAQPPKPCNCDPTDDSLTVTIDTADMHGLTDVQSARIAASKLARALQSPQSSIFNSSQGQQRLRRPGIGRQPSATARDRGFDQSPKAVESSRSAPRCISLHASSSFDKSSFDVNESELPPLFDATSSEICSDLKAAAEANDDISHDRHVADANVYRRLRFRTSTAAPQVTTTATASFEAQAQEMPSKQIKSEAPLQTSYSASTTAVSSISSHSARTQPTAPAITQRAAGLPSGLMQRRQRGVLFVPESKNLDHATANPTTPQKTLDQPRPCKSIHFTIDAAEHDYSIATAKPLESLQPAISTSDPGSPTPSPERRTSVAATVRQISCTQESPLQHPKQPSRIPSPNSNYWQSAKSHRAASAGSHAKPPQTFKTTESNVHCFKESPSKLPVLGEVRAAAAATSALRPPTTPPKLSDALRTPRLSTRRMSIGAYPGAPTITLDGRSGGCSPMSSLHSTHSMLSSPLLQHSPLRHKAIA